MPSTEIMYTCLLFNSAIKRGDRQQYIIRSFTNQSGVYFESMTAAIRLLKSLGTAGMFIIDEVKDTCVILQ